MATATVAALVGCWQLVSADASLPPSDRVEMEFKPSGELIYAVLEKDRWSIMLLTYRVDGKHIISNQPSAPREERTEFSLASDGSLSLTLGGTSAGFKRVQSCTFPTPEKKAGFLQRLVGSMFG